MSFFQKSYVYIIKRNFCYCKLSALHKVMKAHILISLCIKGFWYFEDLFSFFCILFFTQFLKIILLLFNYSCLNFLPTPSKPPSFPCSTLPLGFVHVSFEDLFSYNLFNTKTNKQTFSIWEILFKNSQYLTKSPASIWPPLKLNQLKPTKLKPAVGQNHRLARKQGRTAEEPEWELGMGGAGLGCCGRELRKLWDRETSSGLGVVSAAGLGEAGTN